MDYLGKIKARVKKSIENVDWDEVQERKNDVLQKAKNKTHEYKDEILDQSKSIKEELDKKYKDRIGEKLYNKKKELSEREKVIRAKEIELQKREDELDKNYHFSKNYVRIPIALIVVAIIVSVVDLPFGEKYDSKDVSTTYNGLNTGDPGFDIGGYCLEVESNGVMGFVQCMGLSVVKLFNGEEK